MCGARARNIREHSSVGLFLLHALAGAITLRTNEGDNWLLESAVGDKVFVHNNFPIFPCSSAFLSPPLLHTQHPQASSTASTSQPYTVHPPIYGASVHSWFSTTCGICYLGDLKLKSSRFHCSPESRRWEWGGCVWHVNQLECFVFLPSAVKYLLERDLHNFWAHTEFTFAPQQRGYEGFVSALWQSLLRHRSANRFH